MLYSLYALIKDVFVADLDPFEAELHTQERQLIETVGVVWHRRVYIAAELEGSCLFGVAFRS